MLNRLSQFTKKLWEAAPVATVILGIALAAGLYFAGSVVYFWSTRPHVAREQPVAAWMTPRYISHSWRIPRDIFFDAIEFPRPPPNGPMSLTQLAEFRGVPVAQVIAEAEAAIAAHRGPQAQGSGDETVSGGVSGD